MGDPLPLVTDPLGILCSVRSLPWTSLRSLRPFSASASATSVFEVCKTKGGPRAALIIMTNDMMTCMNNSGLRCSRQTRVGAALIIMMTNYMMTRMNNSGLPLSFFAVQYF